MTQLPERSERQRDIQGLRAISVLLVVLFHIGLPVPGGFAGVDVFFVISGFVITGSLSKEWARSGTIRLRSFYLRRIRRLLPALALVVAFTAVVSVLLESPNGAQQGTAKTGFGALSLVSNFAILRWTGDYFGHFAEQNPLLHTWSLSVEEQFFLVFPTLLLVGWLVGRRFNWLRLGPIAALTIIALPSLALSLATSFGHLHIPVVGGTPQSFAFYSSATRAWEFAVGSLLYLGLERKGQMSRRSHEASGILGLVAILLSALLVSGSHPYPGVAALVPVCGAALLIFGGRGPQTTTTWLLTRPPLVRIGDLSYSWYLWHWPFIVFAKLVWSDEPWVLVGAIVLSLLPAAASYRWVESPIRSSPRLTGGRLASVVVVAVLVPVGLTVSLGIGAKHGWGLDWAVGSHTVVNSDCVSSEEPRRCTWPKEPLGGTVVLAGDSQSWSVADGVIVAATKLEHQTTVASANGCPFILLPPDDHDDSHGRAPIGVPSCVKHRTGVIQLVRDMRPSVVLIANADYAHPNYGANSGEWEEALKLTVESIRAEGAAVVIMVSRPDGDKDPRASILFPGDPNRWTDAASARRGRSWDKGLAERISASDPGVGLFDPADTLCDDEICWSARDGTDYYMDGGHLSKAGAILLVPALQAVLEPLIAQGRA